ncbi:MAG TPA: hypothetical protein VJH34_03055 [archaeon]|nr:hypothetical protein [archaeon]
MLAVKTAMRMYCDSPKCGTEITTPTVILWEDGQKVYHVDGCSTIAANYEIIGSQRSLNSIFREVPREDALKNLQLYEKNH